MPSACFSAVGPITCPAYLSNKTHYDGLHKRKAHDRWADQTKATFRNNTKFSHKTPPTHTLRPSFIYLPSPSSTQFKFSPHLSSQMETPMRLLASLLSFSIISLARANSFSCELNSTKHHHRWIGPTGHRTIVVDATGSGNFLSVQEAIDSIPENNSEKVTLQINAGSYM